MKRIFKVCVVAIAVMTFASVRNETKAQVSASISFEVFYDELSPYGRWINYPQHGYVWSPDDRYRDFHPYRTGGHWVWSDDYEWMWVSDYDWGWAAFHYGRWLYDPYYGWLWVPGYEWAPAWVVWRTGGDYYGWAPMSPGISISLYFGRYSPPADYWCFAPRRYISSPRISNYCINTQRNVTIINNTTIINNYSTSRNVFVTGPDRRDVERYTGSRIEPVRFRESRRPGRTEYKNNEVTLYRPEIRREGNNYKAPGNVDQYRKWQDDEVTVERRSRDNIDRRNRNNAPVRNEQRPFRNENRNDNNVTRERNKELYNDRRNNRNIYEQQNRQPVEKNDNRRFEQRQDRRTFENNRQQNNQVQNRRDNNYNPNYNPGNNQQRQERRYEGTPNRQQQPNMQNQGGQRREARQAPARSEQQQGNQNSQGNSNEKKKNKKDG